MEEASLQENSSKNSNMNNNMMNNINNNVDTNNLPNFMNNQNNNLNNNMPNNIQNNMLDNNMSNNIKTNNMPNNNMFNNMVNNNISGNMSNNNMSNSNNMSNNNMPNTISNNNMSGNIYNNIPNNNMSDNNISGNISNNMPNNNMSNNNITNNMSNNIPNNNMPNNNMSNNMSYNNMSNNMSYNSMPNNMSYNNVPNNMSNNNMPNNMSYNNITNNMSNNNMSYNNIPNNMSNNNMPNNNQEHDYAKIVIQAFYTLNYFKYKLFFNDTSKSNKMKDFTNNFKFLFSIFFGGMNEQYFGYIMKIYNQHMINNNKMNTPEPYTFLSETLNILKEENQKAIITQNEQMNIFQKWLSEKYNFDACFKSFRKYVKEYEKCFICDSFYFSLFEKYMCNNCKEYYHISLLPILEINLDQFSKEGAMKYNVTNYLNYDFGNQPTICQICHNQAQIEYKIISNSPIFIIHFYRNDPKKNHNTEINLDINLDLSSYIKEIDKCYPNKRFILKGYISYDDQIGYFIDYNFKIDNDTFMWLRFNKDKYTQINNHLINNCKPILLFYEAIDDKLELKAEKEAINMRKQQIQINQYSQGNNQFVQQIPSSNSMHINNNMNNIYNTNNMNTQMNNNYNNNFTGNNNIMTGQMNPMVNPMQTMNQQQIIQMMQQPMQPNMQQQMNQFQQNIQQQQFLQYQQQLNLRNCMQTILNSQGNQSLNTASTNNQSNQQPETSDNNINIYFCLVDENNQDDESKRLLIQAKKDDKMNEILKKYYTKLLSDENSIKKFIFNGNEIPKTSTQTANELKFTEGCKVKAIKNNAAAK